MDDDDLVHGEGQSYSDTDLDTEEELEKDELVDAESPVLFMWHQQEDHFLIS